jgi:hypothetical protein
MKTFQLCLLHPIGAGGKNPKQKHAMEKSKKINVS